jgi:hypothetical protein
LHEDAGMPVADIRKRYGRGRVRLVPRHRPRNSKRMPTDDEDDDDDEDIGF